MLLLLIAPLSAGAADPVTVGVLAPRGQEQALAEWGPTMAHLRRSLPDHHFELRPLALEELEAAVADAQVDFVITSPGQYVLLGAPHELSWLATLRSPLTGSSREARGSVLLVRADSPFLHPADLRGRPVGAVHPRGFGGYLLLVPKLRELGIEPEAAYRLRFLGYPIDRLLYRLQEGAVDAVIAPACLLEQMSAEGLVVRERFRSLLPDIALDGCLSNTPAYPNWSFAALPHVPEQLTRQVTLALLAQTEGGRSVWGAAISPAQIDMLYHDLRLHPLQPSLRAQIGQALQRYWPYVMLALLLAVIGLLHYLWLQRLALRRSRQLAAAQLRLREREQELAEAQRWSLLGELAAGLAHELNQPLAAIRHYAEGCALRLQQQDPAHVLLPILQRIDQEAARGAAVIQKTRQWLQAQPPRLETLDIAALLRDLTEMQRPQLARQGIELRLELPATPLPGRGYRLGLEQVLVNLIHNSAQAYQARGKTGRIVVSAEARGGAIVIRVRDAAGGFSPERLREPFAPFRSTRAGGLGMGLLICQRLMQAQGGRLELANADGGAEVSLSLPTGEHREQGIRHRSSG